MEPIQPAYLHNNWDVISLRKSRCHECPSQVVPSDHNTWSIMRNSWVYRKWVNRGRIPRDRDKVREVQNATKKLIQEAKLAYYTNPGTKFSEPKLGQKHFWI